MKKYTYSISTNVIWTTFGFGEVTANSIEEAKQKAIEKLKYDFGKANEALMHCDITSGFLISFDEHSVLVEEVKSVTP